MPKCRDLLLVLAADMCIAKVRVRSEGVDVSMSWGILMFIWGNPSAEVSRSFTSSCPMRRAIANLGVHIFKSIRYGFSFDHPLGHRKST